VQFRSPQRFIRINVSDATDQGLIQECSLYFGVFCAKPAAKSLSVKSRIERVSRNMRYRGRHARIVTSVTCGVRITGIDEIIDCHRPKDPLVDKPDRTSSCTGFLQLEKNPQV
jgi:hypothetical protein